MTVTQYMFSTQSFFTLLTAKINVTLT